MSSQVVCLPPARNEALDLPGFFESARRFCDAVFALDDGSTDNTADMLSAEPLVQVLLKNSRREYYRGWDAAANRNRLLDASAALEPEWIISIDVVERIDAGDAAASAERVSICDRIAAMVTPYPVEVPVQWPAPNSIFVAVVQMDGNDVDAGNERLLR